MNPYDKELLSRIENLIRSFQAQVRDSEGTSAEASMVLGLRGLVNLANMVLKQQDVFGIEPWHILSSRAPLSAPGEMLLRLKDYKGEPISPYPMIMAFYASGYTAQIDGILFLAALGQFARESLKPKGVRQVSINISARSLRDADFVKVTIERLESLRLTPEQKIIIEIHESSPHLTMSRQVLELYKMLGVSFAIDDVGLNMGDVLRLAEFEELAEFIKIDRHAVCAHEGASNALPEVMKFMRALMPGAIMIAEGVQTPEHAATIARAYPEIVYAQGLYLTNDREKFKQAFYAAAALPRSALPDMNERIIR